LGLDFGASKICGASWISDESKIVVDELGNRLIPNYVAFTS
jgi:molecular chaperone DnaK (HSP70)